VVAFDRFAALNNVPHDLAIAHLAAQRKEGRRLSSNSKPPDMGD
jgi:hypothetical protein